MKRYILKNREGALSVAMREGLPLCMLIAANPNASWRAGSYINIPPANWCTHKTCILDAPLIEFSERKGIPMRHILKENNCSHPSELRQGSHICIPKLPEGSQMYTAKGAESFSDIARKFGITEKILAAANPDIKGIYAGLQLIIPSK